MDEPAIQFDNVSYTYSDSIEALHNITLTIAHGESVGLIGSNGSGKTTLLLHVVGILENDSHVKVSGITVTHDHLKDIRKRVGYIFHDSRDQLFMSTVNEDVAFGPLNLGLPREDVGKAVVHALESVGMTGYGHRVPYHLATGEMRRVAIATVLAMFPDIIVMDEPSSGLDPRARREIASHINKLTCTKLIASHDLTFIKACTDRVVLLNHGKIVADGQTGAILNDRMLLEENGL